MDIKRRPGINRDSKTPTPTTTSNASAAAEKIRFESSLGGEELTYLSDGNVTQYQDISVAHIQTEDDDEEDEEEEEEEQPQAVSVKNTPEPPSRNRSKLEASGRKKTFTPETYRPQSRAPPKPRQPLKDTNTNGGLGILPILVVLLVALLLCYFLAPKFTVSSDGKAELTCSFDKLQRSHPQQHATVWDSLSAGIENILNKRSRMPAVYLFVHRGGVGVQKLVKEIATASSKCFGHEMRPVEMKPEDFTSHDAIQDYGHAIEKYKQKTKNGQVILIANLNEIPAAAARALHAICDTHNPIVEDVIIFLTLFTMDSEGNPVQRAEDTLFDMWSSKMQRYELDPLITRVTDQVIALQS